MKTRQTILSVLLTAINGLIGWQFWCFLMVYKSGEATQIAEGLESYFTLLPFFALLGLMITLISAATLLLSDSTKIIFQSKQFRILMGFQISFFTLLIVDTYLYSSGLHFNFFELLIVGVGLFMLYLTGSAYYQSGMQMYQHPTTFGGTYIQSALIGIACYLLFPTDYTDARTAANWILLFIILDMFILIGRFRFLTQTSESTNRVARKLMGEYIFIFGARIIIGVFIPLVYVIYEFFNAGSEFKGVAILLVLGALLQPVVMGLAGYENTYTEDGGSAI